MTVGSRVKTSVVVWGVARTCQSTFVSPGKINDTVATDRRAVGAALIRSADVAGRGAEKRGRRLSLMILLHFADDTGLEEGGTRDRCPERDGSVGVGRAVRTRPLNTGS